MLGDIFQIPAVIDTSLYELNRNSNAYMLYRMFDTSINLKQVLRIDKSHK